jgi:hypothetical protein
MTVRVGKGIFEGMRHPCYTYGDVKYNKKGWADVRRYLPAEYDLVKLRVKGKKDSNGWSTGTGWDGFHITKDDVVLYWRLIE